MESQKSHNNNKNEIKKAIQLISKLEGKKLTIEVKRLIKLFLLFNLLMISPLVFCKFNSKFVYNYIISY